MLQRLIVIAAFSLPLPLVCLAAEKGPVVTPEKAAVTTMDADALQLQALQETASKLQGLANLPPDGAKPAPEKAAATKRVKKVRRKGHGPVHAVAQVVQKPQGRRLTRGEVQAIMAGNRDLSGADLSGLDLEGIDLSGANLARADLERANLKRADLSEADLEQADLTNANLTRASLHMARLHGTRIWGARLDGALWTDRTICRSGSLGTCRDSTF